MTQMTDPRKALRRRFNRLVQKWIYTSERSHTEIAEALGISRQVFDRKLDDDDETKSIAAWELDVLCDLLPGLAEDLGWQRVKRGEVTVKAPIAAGADSMREVGEVLTELAHAVENGITEGEAAALTRSIREARQALNDLEASIAAHVVLPIDVASRR